MPVLVTQNLKKKINVNNMMEFKIDEIEEEIDDEDEIHISYKVKGEWFEQYDFRHNFIPAFCYTLYKY